MSAPLQSRPRLALRRQSPPPPYSSEPAPEYQNDTTTTATTPPNPSRRTDNQLQDTSDVHDATLFHSDIISVPIPPDSPHTYSPVLPESEVVVTIRPLKIRGTPTAVSQAAASLLRMGSAPFWVNERAVDDEEEVWKGGIPIVRKMPGHGSWYLACGILVGVVSGFLLRGS